MATWPSNFCAMSGSFQEESPDNTIRSSMDTGPAKVRRRSTANVRSIGFKMRLRKADIANLDTFYQSTTFGGVDPFDYVHPRTGVTEQARFVQSPVYRHLSADIYETDISLELLP